MRDGAVGGLHERRLLDGRLQAVVALADADEQQQDVAGLPDLARRVVDVGPHGDLGAAGEVFDGDGDERLAGLRRERADAVDHAGDDDLAAVEFGRDLADQRRRVSRDRDGGTRERML